jgi:hypothetical protein
MLISVGKQNLGAGKAGPAGLNRAAAKADHKKNVGWCVSWQG